MGTVGWDELLVAVRCLARGGLGGYAGAPKREQIAGGFTPGSFTPGTPATTRDGAVERCSRSCRACQIVYAGAVTPKQTLELELPSRATATLP
ncbi:hypothetical protein PSPO01_12955 [Paraphaeosphaeria sporulosa]